MNITKRVVTTTLEKSTDIADYIIEHMTEDNTLTRIHVTIKEKNTENVLGTIYQEHNSTGGNFSLLSDVTPYFVEFNAFLTEVQSSITPEIITN